MTITTYTDREIALRQQLAAATQLAKLNGEIAAELKADKLALEAAIETSRKQQVVDYYDIAQLKQYGNDRAREALEMAAKVSDKFKQLSQTKTTRVLAALISHDIRTLAKEIK